MDEVIRIFGPSYSASMHVDQPAVTISLAFYRVWDEAESDGRYLTVSTPGGKRTQAMCGFDWFHYSHTRIYRAGDHAVAVLAEDDRQCDYIISLDPLAVVPFVKGPPETWTYLGAFDLVRGTAKDTFELRFAPASDER